jgi:dihydroorotate dehydrogenase (NAD+) catalytic subunit
MSASLQTKLLGIKLKTPLMAASGTFGFGEEFLDFLNQTDVGAIVVKGMTREPRKGNAGRRMAETPSGMLNCIGLQNPGVDVFLREILPRIKQLDTPIIVNINGNVQEDYAYLAEVLDESGVAGIEVNISCPNTHHGCMAFGVIPETAASVTAEVKKRTKLPVIVKLSPNVTDIAEIARAVEAAGADAVSLINTLVGMAIDTRTWQPVLGNVVGGLSGPAVKPVALRMVWQTAQAVKIPVIGMGGIATANDAVEFLLAGASAIAVGTANFVNPRAISDIAAGLTDYLAQRQLTHVSQLVGKIRRGE